MQQYRVEFFETLFSETPSNRKLSHTYHDYSNDLAIDDDYIAVQTSSLSIKTTDLVKKGQFIRVLRDSTDYFFGLVTDSEPGDYLATVSFKPFIALFDTNILFNVLHQYKANREGSLTLENTLKTYITNYFVSNGDFYQNYPITINVTSETTNWNMNIVPDVEEDHWAIVGLYETLIVRALKEYGVAINVTPDFSTGEIALTIGKISGVFNIDANLKNVEVKTLKVNDRPISTNKLIVYDKTDYTRTPIIFYVRPDRSWGTDDDASKPRIYPVSLAITAVTPTNNYEDAELCFLDAALDAANGELNGGKWDNLIELVCALNDPIIKPAQIKNGKLTTVHYQGVSYATLLTGKSILHESVTLMFGSERIQFTKKKTSK